jgi:hypothetical protein
MPRLLPPICTALWLVLIVLPVRAAEDPLYATVILVGPKPQPIVPNVGFGDVSISPDDVFLPSASLPSIASDGGRNLREQAPPHLTAARGKVRPKHHNVLSQWKDKTISNHLTRHSNGTDPVPRSLAGETCTITTTILGFNFDDNFVENGIRIVPPDPHGAAGANRLVAVVNRMIEVRKKDGTLMFRDSLQSFFSATPQALTNNTRFFDPKVIYDEHEGRFVMVALQQGKAPQISRIWLAVSKGEAPDAVSAWNQAYIDSAMVLGGNNAYADFPGLEVDEEAVYVTANMFRFLDDASVGVRYWWFSKGLVAGFYAGQPFTSVVVNPFASAGTATTSMPAQVHGSSGVDGNVGTFFVNVVSFINGQINLQVYILFDPLGEPGYTLQTINLGVISQFGPLPSAPQLGTTTKIETNDIRVLDAAWRSNKLWVVFSIHPTSGVNQGQATAHWVRLSTSGGTVAFEAQGNLGGEGIAAGAFTYFPSIAVNTKGLVAFGYAASSNTTYAGAYVSVGTSEQSYTVKSGLAPYIREYVVGANRWGDYTGISVDPIDDSFWVFNQYADTVGSADAGGNGRWATAWGRLVCTVRFLHAVDPLIRPNTLLTLYLSQYIISEYTNSCSSPSTNKRSYTGANQGSYTGANQSSVSGTSFCSTACSYPHPNAMWIVWFWFIVFAQFLRNVGTLAESLPPIVR